MSITPQPPENGFAPWSLMGPSQGSSPSKAQSKASLIQLEPKAAGQMPANPESSEESEGLSFGDFLDVINPLQHIPVVSTIYRELTGDDISSPARIAGGTLFGGVIGLAAGVINSVVDESSGKDVGEHIVAAFSDDQSPDTKTTDVDPSKSIANATAQASEQLLATTPLSSDQARSNSSVVSIIDSQTSSAPAKPILPHDIQQGPSLEQIAALNMASQDKMKIIAQTNPKISDHVVPLSGPMADKLQAITTGVGGLNLSHMPGVASTNPQPNIQSAAKPTPSSGDNAVTSQAVSGKSFKLSDDVRKQLDRINQIQQERSILSLQEKPTQQPVAIKPEKASEKPIAQTETAPQIAAYQSAKNISTESNANQSVEISEAMMSALQKYDNLLNGRKIN